MTDDGVLGTMDPEAQGRWREWQARGAASDRRSALRMKVLVLLVVVALAAWFLVAV